MENVLLEYVLIIREFRSWSSLTQKVMSSAKFKHYTFVLEVTKVFFLCQNMYGTLC